MVAGRRMVAGFGAAAVVVAGFMVQGAIFAPRLRAQTTESTTAQTAAQAAPTTTQLSISTLEGDSRTRARFTVHVMGVESSATPAGSVSVKLGERSLGSAILDENGFATYTVDAFPQGRQQIIATYDGSTQFAPSTSPARPLDSVTSGLPDYTIAASATALTVKAGQYGTITVTLTPEQGFNQIVSYSCSGLPVSATCTFTPEQVSPNSPGSAADAPVVTTLNIQTVSPSGGRPQTAQASPGTPAGSRPLYALVFPGVLALVGLGAARKRLPGLRMLCLAALLVLSGLALSACSDRYDYLHHPPIVNPGTPPGLSDVVVSASSSSGSVAILKTIHVALTVTK